MHHGDFVGDLVKASDRNTNSSPAVMTGSLNAPGSLPRFGKLRPLYRGARFFVNPSLAEAIPTACSKRFRLLAVRSVER